ncbi:conserved hypothetical protein [Culex quinquefasciatus]|uniref:C2 domain-containing protein n=1 Tax=Culex quinquefasciatus TaxID=7176 RepID=B0XKD0_CULQU|nr:conserved hypothetical protein [Culex quinquefasciatus]|eukprot:XP_001870102.1 conserved hypothetical protein [Culex quinquefasciatus]
MCVRVRRRRQLSFPVALDENTSVGLVREFSGKIFASPSESSRFSENSEKIKGICVNRWSRGRSKERLRGSCGQELERHDSQSDYAADNSSEHSSSATPQTQSPRHRAQTLSDSPLAARPVVIERNASMSSEGTGLKVTTTKADVELVAGVIAGTSGSGLVAKLVGNDVPGTSGLGVIPGGIGEDPQRRREAVLRQHSFFQLRIHLVSGHNLVAMDKSGTSDPYVKFKVGGRLLYKSKTVHKELNPVWDETFIVPIEDPFQPINIKVFDYDWGLQDDFMGSAKLQLQSLELNRVEEMTIRLEDAQRANKDLGEIRLNVTLWPKTQEDKEQGFNNGFIKALKMLLGFSCKALNSYRFIGVQAN